MTDNPPKDTKTEDKYLILHTTSKADLDYMENFSYAIASGFRAMATILAYLMFFTIGINILEHLKLFSIISNELVSSAIKGLFEMTLGINLVGLCSALQLEFYPLHHYQKIKALRLTSKFYFLLQFQSFLVFP